ncbi:MAG TPA: penicillin-binding protein 2 [Thermoanaerobaculia bacterium]|nr:penicillin-binding protein 2 [Thermoanaerobaculia bacterium]
MKTRLRVLAGLGLVWVALIAGRLYYLQVIRHAHYAKRAGNQQQRVVELDPPRGTIYDARGRELAVSIEVDSVYAVPSEIADPSAAAHQLAQLVEKDPGKLAKQLGDRDRDFVWIKRKLDPPTAEKIRALHLSGLRFVTESKRYYPMRELAAQVLGFVGTENHGLEGLEQLYDQTVAGKPGRRTVLRDARKGTVMDPELSFTDPEPGRDLHLSLDATIQHIVERELAQSVDERGARKGMAVFLDARTGGVLALASYPSFDPNLYGDTSKDLWRNRAVTDFYEPGSTFKIVTAAAALESGLVKASDTFDCGMGQITLAGIRIRDHKPFGILTFAEAIAKSSNVGMIKTALLLGDERLYGMASALGFGRKTGIDLPGEASGILHPLSEWRRFPLSKAYISFGQGVSVTPLQLAVAAATVANGGVRLQPYIVASTGGAGQIEPLHAAIQPVGRAMSAATAAELTRLLEGVVTAGTAKSAAVAGYNVAGKTGTAQIPLAGSYDRNHYVPSFVGFAPGDRPQIVGVVAIDAPQGFEYHGGQVAAPVFGAIARQVLLYLGVRPERTRPEWPDGQAMPKMVTAGLTPATAPTTPAPATASNTPTAPATPASQPAGRPAVRPIPASSISITPAAPAPVAPGGAK